jgi:hypothetical protein
MASNKLYRLLVFIVTISLLVSGCSGGQATATFDPLTASLSEVSGTVNARNPGEADFSAAPNGFTLKAAGEVSTGEDGRTQVNLSSGTSIRVGGNTIFTLTSNEPQSGSLLTRLKLEAGRIWIALNGGSMDIETPSGLASVRGSNLMVWVDPATQNVYVSCFEGSCGAENSAQFLGLTTGNGAILYYVANGGNPPPPESYVLTWADFEDWANNNPDVQAILPSIIQTLTAIPTLTPTLAPTPTATATATFTPTATEQTCFTLTTPENGVTLPSEGQVLFSWTSMPGAAKYQITFTASSGAWNRYSLGTNTSSFDIGSLYNGGTFTWKIEAFDTAGALLCTAPEFTFTKPSSPTPTITIVPYTGIGNTTFKLVNPAEATGTIICDGSTLPNFTAAVMDPDGIKSISVHYNPSISQPGVLQMGNDGYWYQSFTPAFTAGETVNWYFSAVDGVGNIENSSQYQFTCQIF